MLKLLSSLILSAVLTGCAASRGPATPGGRKVERHLHAAGQAYAEQRYDAARREAGKALELARALNQKKYIYAAALSAAAAALELPSADVEILLNEAALQASNPYEAYRVQLVHAERLRRTGEREQAMTLVRTAPETLSGTLRRQSVCLALRVAFESENPQLAAQAQEYIGEQQAEDFPPAYAGMLFSLRGEFTAAADLFTRAAEEAAATGISREVAVNLARAGDAYYADGREQEAMRSWLAAARSYYAQDAQPQGNVALMKAAGISGYADPELRERFQYLMMLHGDQLLNSIAPSPREDANE